LRVVVVVIAIFDRQAQNVPADRFASARSRSCF
jgi:hypothetical protein